MLLMIPMTRFISKKLAAIQRELMKVKDRRINTTSEALEGMKLIKLQSWEKAFLQRISGLRCDELAVLRRYVWMQTFSQCMWNTTPYLVSTLTFLLYVLLGNPLTASAAFVSLSLSSRLLPFTVDSISCGSPSLASRRCPPFLQVTSRPSTASPNARCRCSACSASCWRRRSRCPSAPVASRSASPSRMETFSGARRV